MRLDRRVHARAALFRAMQEFFETRLMGLYRWDGCGHFDPEPAPVPPGRARDPHGRLREIATVQFGRFELELASSRERPPLGRAVLRLGGRAISEGPIDAATWDKFASLVKQQPVERITQDVAGQPWQ